MDKVANLSAGQRRDLFRETAAKRAMNPAIVEKDFWVCWVLKHLFPRQVEAPSQGRVIAIPHVGGLHHRYARRAA